MSEKKNAKEGRTIARNKMVDRATKSRNGIRDENNADRTINLNRITRVENMLSASSCDYLNLIHRPWDAPFENARNPTYADGVGHVTSVIRCFNWRLITIPAGFYVNIMFQPNPGSLADNGYVNESSARYIFPAATPRGVAGCPPYEHTGAQFAGNCGYFTLSGSAGTFGTFQRDILDTDTQTLDWAAAPAFGDMRPGEPAQFKYRCLAGGMKVVPTAPNVELGGYSASTLLPTADNNGVAGTSQPFLSPDTHITRADHEIELRWLPSAEDTTFSYPTDATASLNLINQRQQLHLMNPSGTDTYPIMVQYVAFYEVAGACQQSNGQFSACQPEQGAQIHNGIAAYQYSKGDSAGQAADEMAMPAEMQREKVSSNREIKAHQRGAIDHVRAEVIKSKPLLAKAAEAAELAEPTGKPFFKKAATVAMEAAPLLLSLL